VKKQPKIIFLILITTMVFAVQVNAGGFNFWNEKPDVLQPEKGKLYIDLAKISDGKAHFFSVVSSNGTHVDFFTLRSHDGVIRAAMDSCDVCYRAGKGYKQEGDNMVCQNCGKRFASHKINEVKGGCNPAPLKRKVVGDKLVISMTDIDENSWYFSYRK
jgi:uncharacterized membrane protein